MDVSRSKKTRKKASETESEEVSEHLAGKQSVDSCCAKKAAGVKKSQSCALWTLIWCVSQRLRASV
jgi:hypothetical protein